MQEKRNKGQYKKVYLIFIVLFRTGSSSHSYYSEDKVPLILLKNLCLKTVLLFTFSTSCFLHNFILQNVS